MYNDANENDEYMSILQHNQAANNEQIYDDNTSSIEVSSKERRSGEDEDARVGLGSRPLARNSGKQNNSIDKQSDKTSSNSIEMQLCDIQEGFAAGGSTAGCTQRGAMTQSAAGAANTSLCLKEEMARDSGNHIHSKHKQPNKIPNNSMEFKVAHGRGEQGPKVQRWQRSKGGKV